MNGFILIIGQSFLLLNSRYGTSQQAHLKPVSMVILVGCYVSSGVALTLMLLLPGATTSVYISGE